MFSETDPPGSERPHSGYGTLAIWTALLVLYVALRSWRLTSYGLWVDEVFSVRAARLAWRTACPVLRRSPNYQADTVVRRFQWEIRYTAESYIRLLETFSGHIDMEPWQKDRLYGEIRRRLALRPDGLVRRHWGGVLHVARKP